jgi:hypothetical protein
MKPYPIKHFSLDYSMSDGSIIQTEMRKAQMKLSGRPGLVLCFTLLTFLLTSGKTLSGENPMQEQKLQPPAIVSPEELSEFRGVNSIKFLWRQVPDAAAYHIVLAKDRVFRKISYEDKKVLDPYYLIGPLDYGTYFFRIRSIDSSGNEGPYSPTRSFIIVPPPPSSVLLK